MQTARNVLLALLAGAAGFSLGRQMRFWSAPGTLTTHTGPTIEQIQRLAELVTTRVEIADVQVTSAAGYVGGMKIAMVIKGDYLPSVDLARARFENVDAQARTAVLVLPQPQVISPRLDHGRTRLFEISTQGLWQLVPSDSAKTAIINRSYSEAQELVTQAANDPKIIERSRQQARSVIGSFFQAQGWSLTIMWTQ